MGEKLYECEVKRQRVIEGERVSFWKTKSVREALMDEDTDFRCNDCHGAVKLFRKHVDHGAAPHAEHKSKQDSEFCIAGFYFRQAKDGRTPRMSAFPVE
jgi:hypothetical protein